MLLGEGAGSAGRAVEGGVLPVPGLQLGDVIGAGEENFCSDVNCFTALDTFRNDTGGQRRMESIRLLAAEE